MAYTKTHPIKSTLKRAIEYICNPTKTDESLLISSFGCLPETADIEFAWTRRHAIDKGTNLGRHLIQSFDIGETTSEQAHEIGMKLATEILGGKYEFVLATHIDKGHVHNHLIFNAVNFKDFHYYHSNKRSYWYIRRVSDRLCKEYGLSVIVPERTKEKDSSKGIVDGVEKTYKAKLKRVIDKHIPTSNDFEDLLLSLKNEGYEIKRGKYIACKAPDQERFTRMKSLGVDYTEEAIIHRITGGIRPSKQSRLGNRNISLLIDLQNSIKAQQSAGFAYWAKINNLKQAARTLNFLTEHNIISYEELLNKTKGSIEREDRLQKEIKDIEDKQTKVMLLMKQVEIYRCYKSVYTRYRSSLDKEKFLRGHESAIILFEAAARALRDENMDKLPSSEKFSMQEKELAEKKERLYKEYRVAKQESRELHVIKQNVDIIFSNTTKTEISKEKEIKKNRAGRRAEKNI